MEDMIKAIIGPHYEMDVITDANGRTWTRYLSHRYSIISDVSGKYNIVVDKMMKNVYRKLSIAYNLLVGGQSHGAIPDVNRASRQVGLDGAVVPGADH